MIHVLRLSSFFSSYLRYTEFCRSILIINKVYLPGSPQVSPVAIPGHKVRNGGHGRYHPLIGPPAVEVRSREADGEFFLRVMGPRIVGPKESVLLKRVLHEDPRSVGKLQMYPPGELVRGIVYRAGIWKPEVIPRVHPEAFHCVVLIEAATRIQDKGCVQRWFPEVIFHVESIVPPPSTGCKQGKGSIQIEVGQPIGIIRVYIKIQSTAIYNSRVRI